MRPESREPGAREQPTAAVQTAALNLATWARTLPVLEELNRRGLPFIVLKSLPQIEDLYGHPGARLSNDVDLVVRAGDAPAVIQLLDDLGWRWDTADRARFDALVRHVGVAVASCYRTWQFAHPSTPGPSPIDLHFDVGNPTQRAVLDPAIWRRAQPISRDGIDFLVLSPEDRLLFLCAHFAFEALGDGFLWYKLADIRRILERGGLDWQYLAERARATGTTSALNLVCDTVVQRFDLCVESVWRKRIPPIPRLRYGFLAYVFHDRGERLSSRERSLFHLLLHDRPLDMLPAWKHILVPSQATIAADYLGYWPSWPAYVRQLGRIYAHRMRKTLTS